MDNISIRYIKGVGEAREKKLAKLGIHTVRQLLCYFPRKYEDRGNVKNISELCDGEVCSVVGTVSSPPTFHRSRNFLNYSRIIIQDMSGTLTVTLFNREMTAKALAMGQKYRVYGKATEGKWGMEMISPVISILTHF